MRQIYPAGKGEQGDALNIAYYTNTQTHSQVILEEVVVVHSLDRLEPTRKKMKRKKQKKKAPASPSLFFGLDTFSSRPFNCFFIFSFSMMHLFHF